MSEFLKLNWRDVLRGAIVMAGTAVLIAILPILESGSLPTVGELKVIGIAAASSGIAYFLKNLFTNSEGEFKPEK